MLSFHSYNLTYAEVEDRRLEFKLTPLGAESSFPWGVLKNPSCSWNAVIGFIRGATQANIYETRMCFKFLKKEFPYSSKCQQKGFCRLTLWYHLHPFKEQIKFPEITQREYMKSPPWYVVWYPLTIPFQASRVQRNQEAGDKLQVGLCNPRSQPLCCSKWVEKLSSSFQHSTNIFEHLHVPGSVLGAEDTEWTMQARPYAPVKCIV